MSLYSKDCFGILEKALHREKESEWKNEMKHEGLEDDARFRESQRRLRWLRGGIGAQRENPVADSCYALDRVSRNEWGKCSGLGGQCQDWGGGTPDLTLRAYLEPTCVTLFL